MGKLVANLLKKFVNFVPCEDTYFLLVEKPPVRLSREIVKLNYGDMSPFRNGDFVFYQSGNKIYIWFTRYPLKANKLNIPEMFILYRNFRSEEEVIIFLEKATATCVLVLKEGEIVSQFAKSSFENVDEIVDVLKKEYSLRSPKVYRVSPSEVNLSIGFFDMLRFFSSSKMESGRDIPSFIDLVKYPVITTLILLNLYPFAVDFYLSREIDNCKKRLEKLQSLTRDVKELFNVMEKEAKFWDSFISAELKRPFLLPVLDKVVKVVGAFNGEVRSVAFSGRKIVIRISAPSTSSIVEKLLSLKTFSKVKVINTSKNTGKGLEDSQIEMVVKEVYGE